MDKHEKQSIVWSYLTGKMMSNIILKKQSYIICFFAFLSLPTGLVSSLVNPQNYLFLSAIIMAANGLEERDAEVSLVA